MSNGETAKPAAEATPGIAARGGGIDREPSAGGEERREETGAAPHGRHVPPPVVPAAEDAVAPSVPAARGLPPQSPAGVGGPAVSSDPSPAGLVPTTTGPPGTAPPAPPLTGAGPLPGGRIDPFRLPAANWTWLAALAGLLLGAAPEGLLYLVALLPGTATETDTAVTTGSAVALAVGSLVLYGWQTLAAWLFSLRTAGRRLALWGFRRPTRAFFWTIPLALVVVYAVSIGHDMLVHPQEQDIISAFPHSGIGVALFILVAVVMAPLFEEIVFRGFLFRGFANAWGWKWGALASAAVFGLAHLQLDLFIPLGTLGLALAWVYRRTGSLWTSIAMHALFNSIAVISWALTG